MRNTLIAIGLVWHLIAIGQQAVPQWVACTECLDGEQVMFRRWVELPERPQRAVLTVATGGSCVAYVNGYNVSVEPAAPIVPGMAAPMQVATYDVGHLLHAGSNVVALWYAPRHATLRQVAAMLHVVRANGTAMAMATDGSWQCRKSGAIVTPCGTEHIDGTLWQADWSWPESAVPCWQDAHDTGLAAPEAAFATRRHGAMWRVASCRPSAYFNNHGQSVEYHFKEQAMGWVRVTLRGMSRGDTIRVGGLSYICTGKDDEQACRMFTVAMCSPTTVSGPPRFSPENITLIEAIGLETVAYDPYAW